MTNLIEQFFVAQLDVLAAKPDQHTAAVYRRDTLLAGLGEKSRLIARRAACEVLRVTEPKKGRAHA